MGPPGGPIFGPVFRFEVFSIKVSELQPFGFNEGLWLMATERATVRRNNNKKPPSTGFKQQPICTPLDGRNLGPENFLKIDFALSANRYR